MTAERRVAVVTDTGSSLRPEDPRIEELGISLLPLEVIFKENDREVARLDTEMTAEEFYTRMRNSPELPTTSGAVRWRALELYRRLSLETDSIISIHITAKHSAVWGDALKAAQEVQEKMGEGRPELRIDVIDSKNISAATLFPVLRAAEMAQEGADLETIKEEMLALVPKTGLRAALSTLENARKGGRISGWVERVTTLIGVKTIVELRDGSVEPFGVSRTMGKARKAMLASVGRQGALAKMAVVHTNALNLGEAFREELTAIYSGEIPIFEAGPALGVHAGEGAVGVAFQRA